MPPSKPIRRTSDRPPKGKKPIVPHFNTTMFDEAMEGLGLVFRWSRAIVCPCRLNDDTDQWDPTCAYCGGDGWWYRNPEMENQKADPPFRRDYFDLKCVFSSANHNPDLYQPFGRWDFGDATLTVPANARVGFRDRFVGLEQELAWTEFLIRDQSEEYVSVGKSTRSTEKQRKTMRYAPVAMQVCATMTQDFYEGYDFILEKATLTEPQRLKWLPGKGPADGELYSVHYICRPTWIVDKATYAIQNSVGPATGILGKNVRQILPTTVAIRLDYLTQAEGT